MASLPTWEDVRARFQQGAVEHPDVSADWDARQDRWTFSRSETGHSPEEASAEAGKLFKEAARSAVGLLGKLNEPGTPYRVWLDLMRKEKRGFQQILVFETATRFRQFMEADRQVDFSDIPLGESGSIPHVFQESAEFCEDLLARAFEPEKVGKDAAGIIGKLPKDALVRMEAETAAFLAEYLPKLEREASRSGPVHDAELLREVVVHQFNLVARECLAVCASVEEFESELRSDIARFVRYGLTQYPWLAEPMRQELDRGFALFVMGANPWTKIPEKDRASVWHVGAITGEALSHAALRLRAEGWKHAAEGGFSKANQTGAEEPSGEKSTRDDAGPAANGTNPATLHGKGRKRGRPQTIPDDRMAAAAKKKESGGSNRDAAVLIYNTKFPLPQQVKNVPAHLKAYRKKLSKQVAPASRSAQKPRKSRG